VAVVAREQPFRSSLIMLQIEREPDPTAAAIREYLAGNDAMLNDDYQPPRELEHPLAGHCYIASEAYYHLSDSEWTPQFINVEWRKDGRGHRTAHWFLESRSRDRVVDLTVEQFEENDVSVMHGRSRGRGFVPPTPSDRATTVMENIE
jgi:hypothetical protein